MFTLKLFEHRMYQIKKKPKPNPPPPPTPQKKSCLIFLNPTPSDCLIYKKSLPYFLNPIPFQNKERKKTPPNPKAKNKRKTITTTKIKKLTKLAQLIDCTSECFEFFFVHNFFSFIH